MINMKRRLILSILQVVFAVLVFTACGKKSEPIKAEPRSDEELQVIFFEVSDDADSILILGPEAKVMVDCGLSKDASALEADLKALGVDKLDLLVLTHPDKDHIGGIQGVLSAVGVDRVITSAGKKASDESLILEKELELHNIVPEVLNDDLELEFGDLKLQLMAADKKAYDLANDYSVAVMLSFGGRKVFLPGDAERDRIEELLDRNLETVDIYKLPHHGRECKKADKLLSTLEPKYCVVTAREPAESVKLAVRRNGADLLSVFDGDIVFTINRTTGELRVSQN